MESELLGFDQLFEIDIIGKFGEVRISELGEVRFPNLPIYAGHKYHRARWNVKFNQRTKIRTISWKWSDKHPSEYLKNGYLVFKQAKGEY